MTLWRWGGTHTKPVGIEISAAREGSRVRLLRVTNRTTGSSSRTTRRKCNGIFKIRLHSTVHWNTIHIRKETEHTYLPIFGGMERM